MRYCVLFIVSYRLSIAIVWGLVTKHSHCSHRSDPLIFCIQNGSLLCHSLEQWLVSHVETHTAALRVHFEGLMYFLCKH